MTITKKKIDILEIAHIELEHNGQQYKVLLTYEGSKYYEVWIYIARKPHSKFRKWKKIESFYCNIDNYNSFDQMIIEKALQASNDYWEKSQEELTHLKKWQEFIKNT